MKEILQIREFNHDIQPGIGLGPLRLGSTQAEVLAMLGEPSAIEEVDYGDGALCHDWDYEELELTLRFSPDDDYSLGTISTESLSATLRWQYPIGMTEEELLRCDFGGIGPPQADDEFGEYGKNFVWDKLDISCWVRDEIVVSIAIFPNSDATGLIPIWPAR